MIVRSYYACSTCEQAHVVRVGLGQEDYAEHRFPCVSCAEILIIAMRAEQATGAYAYTEPVENATALEDAEGAPIVNLDANFLVPEDQRHTDLSIFRMQQMQKMGRALEKSNTPTSPISSSPVFPHRRIGIEAQWKLLKKAWSLKKNGRLKLSARKVESGTQQIYPLDPLESLTDWIFRFCLFSGGQLNNQLWKSCIDLVKPLLAGSELDSFSSHYQGIRLRRENDYFELIKSFFLAYSEFGQVWYQMQLGIPVEEGEQAGSTGFDQVRMFYGTAFEMFASHVDILAMINNVLVGRQFDTFESMDLEKYLTLDKSSRFNPFAANISFSAICTERDNQLRNASHHNGMTFDPHSQIITYRAGKGGQGIVMEKIYPGVEH